MAETETRWLFVSNEEQLEKIRQVRSELPNLEGTAVFDSGAATPDAHLWAGFLQHGRQVLERPSHELARREKRLGLDDLATIMYTSGTTGNPKGVMLTHGNLLSNVCAVQEAFLAAADALMFSWLPYSHLYARTVDHKEIQSSFRISKTRRSEPRVQARV